MADIDKTSEAWRRADEFMEAWNLRGWSGVSDRSRVGGDRLYEMTLRLARFLNGEENQ